MELKRISIVFIFSAYLLIGLFICPDYGTSYDEFISRKNGLVSKNYIGQYFNIKPVSDNLPHLLSWKDKDYGVFFELILTTAESALGLKDSKYIYLLRHQLTFIAFWLSVIFFYFLGKTVFQDRWIGLLGGFFLVLSPRIFAHSFYNSKDLIFMSFSIITAYTLIRLLYNPSFGNALFHSISSAIFIDTRVAGVYIPFITIVFMGIEILKRKHVDAGPDRLYRSLFAYICFCVCFVYIFWPYLWESPVRHFLKAFQNMSQFRWEGEVLYFGDFIKASNLPWHYIPVWIIITTPILYSFLFLTGLVKIFANFFKNPLMIYQNGLERSQLIFLCLFFCPLSAVILLKSVLYDGWRQMFFIYPAFLMISLNGFIVFRDYIKRRFQSISKFVVYGIISISFLNTTCFMVVNHPHQNVYFNFLASKNAADNFELDYWALSYKQALEYILKTDPDDRIKISVIDIAPGYLYLFMIDRKDRNRIEFVPIKEAEYYISHYRSRESYEKGRSHIYPYINEVFSIHVNHSKIIGVYKPNEWVLKGGKAKVGLPAE